MAEPITEWNILLFNQADVGSPASCEISWIFADDCATAIKMAQVRAAMFYGASLSTQQEFANMCNRRAADNQFAAMKKSLVNYC